MAEHALLRTAWNGLLWHREYHHETVALLHGQRNTVSKAVSVFVIYNEFLNNHLYVMVAVAVQFHSGLYFTQFTIDTDIKITLASYALKQFLVMALAVAHQRGQHINTLPAVLIHHKFHNLLLSELDHFLT